MLHNINYKDVGVEMNKNRKEIEIIDIENTYIFAKSEIEKRIEAVNLQKKEDEKKEQIIFLLIFVLHFRQIYCTL